MKTFVWAGLTVLLLSCAKGQFSGQTTTQETGDVEVETVTTDPAAPASTSTSTTTSTTTTTTSVEPKAIVPDENEAEEPANMPVMIGGAFLVCVQSAQVECRLDTMTARNIAPDPALKLEFFADAQAVGYRNSPAPEFRWRLQRFDSAGALRKITLKVSSAAGTVWTYHDEFEPEALQIGDGTRALQGCTQAFVQRSKLVGLKYEQSYAVQPGTTSVVVNLVGLCGVVRANDSMLQIFDSTGAEVYKKFLPVTQAPLGLNYTVSGLKAGTYLLRLTPGDDIDIDDFFVNSLGISSVL